MTAEQLRPVRVGVGSTPVGVEQPTTPLMTILANTAVGGVLAAGVAGLFGSSRVGFWGVVGAVTGGGLAAYVVATTPSLQGSSA